MKKARFVFWFALVIRISSLTKPSVTQFYQFTTMSSHVSPYTKEKKKKEVFNYPVPSSQQREDLGVRAAASLIFKTLHWGSC